MAKKSKKSTKGATRAKPHKAKHSRARLAPPTPAPLSPPAESPQSQLWTNGRFTKHFKKLYAIIAVVMLLASSAWWAMLGAQVQQSNADQLVNPYLFHDAATRSGALLPATHSFLLKWPLFLIVKLGGYSSASYVIVTVAVVLATVVGLAVLLQRIERRPLVFGTICLALGSVLIAVPAQPYVGGLLPVNMAMLATRNIEYLWFIGCLILLAPGRGVRNRKFYLATVGLMLLFTSDRFFLTLSGGGALAGLIIFALVKRWRLVRVSVDWLAASAGAALGTFALIATINASHALRLADQTTLSPYALIARGSDLLIAWAYAILGLLTNFGANPAAGVTLLRQVPDAALHNLLSPGGLVLLANGLVGLAGLGAVIGVARASGRASREPDESPGIAHTLATMLLLASGSALAAYVLTTHAYAVDARYLTIWLFTVFVALATATRRRAWPAAQLVVVGTVLAGAVLLSTVSVAQLSRQEKSALAVVNDRNSLVVQVLNHHRVDTLVGDYWRVVPAKFAAGPQKQFNIYPLAGCAQAREVLSSSVWQPNLQHHSFAYLLSLDRSLTDFPRCNLKQVVAAYGSPSATTLIAGTLDAPQELLMFYNNGIKKNSAVSADVSPLETVLPIRPDQIPNATCPLPIVMNIVAHQDDDLLFMNPAIMRDIQAGHCVRTVYLTAGDAGSGRFYMLNREQGSEGAYSYMLGQRTAGWVQRIVKLGNKQFVTVASPRGNEKVSLIFMHLPDGDLNGRGFAATNFESLARLREGSLSRIHSIDNQSTYSSDDLSNALSTLMQVYHPTEIRTQSAFSDTQYPDHSDHTIAGLYATAAAGGYARNLPADSAPIPLYYFVGYPVHDMADNVSGQDLVDATTAFLMYARHDGGVCQTEAQCRTTPTYNAYLRTQYQSQY
ncbi:MAG: PIG-L family deacetylase [Candidatus Saccharibacteria bacterium]